MLKILNLEFTKKYNIWLHWKLVFKSLPSAPIEFASIMAKKVVLLPVNISLAKLTPLTEDILC